MNDLTSLLHAEMARESKDTRADFDPVTLFDAARRGSSVRRRNRAAVQSFGLTILIALVGGATWLGFARQGEPDPGATPSPSASPPFSPEPSPTASPTASPVDISGSYVSDEYGLPVFPAADAEVFDRVGPGWVLAEYVGYVPDYSYTREIGLYLIGPAGEAYSVGRIGDASLVLWRPERNEVVISYTHYAEGLPDSIHVYDLVTRTVTLLDPENRYFAFRGTTDDAREIWLGVDTEVRKITGILVVTPDPDEPDTSFVPHDTAFDTSWWLLENTLLAIPGNTIGGNGGSTTVSEVSLDGVATPRTLSPPPSAPVCKPSSRHGWSGDLPWDCTPDGRFEEYYNPEGTWQLPLDGGSATWVPRDDSGLDDWEEIEKRFPGCNGLGHYDDPTPFDRVVTWFSYETPDTNR